jgi:pimeloyl-ACP methyl ester carboxylesterase
MAKLMSKKTKEIVQTTSVIVIILAFLFFYAVYPLIAIPALIGRPDRDKFKDPKFQLQNDPTFFIEKGLNPDTFTVESNDNIRLAALSFFPDTAHSKPLRGTVILLPSPDTNRTSLVDYVAPFLDSGLAVVLYDQRASGLSGGTYHMAGALEADDLTEVIAYLSLHGQFHPPLATVGFGLGGDAAINAARTEKRISFVLAINPNLTATRYIDGIIKKGKLLPIPFSKATYFWWYTKFSSYPGERTDVNDIAPLETPTLILDPAGKLTSPEVEKIQQVSSAGLVRVETLPENSLQLQNLIIGEVCNGLKNLTQK